MLLGKLLVTVQVPQFSEFLVVPRCYLVHIDVLAVAALLVAGKFHIFSQFAFAALQGVGQQVIQSLVVGFVFQDVADEYLYHDAPVLKHSHILLEVACRCKETFGAGINRRVYLDVPAQVIPVAVEDESHFLNSTGGDDLHKVLG